MVANNPPHILMLFWDGVGIGPDDAEVNPFLSASMPNFRSLLRGEVPTLGNGRIRSDGAILVPLDPNLGVAGLPQSATGQTTLLTGINAPKELGSHYGPYPNTRLREILAEENMAKKMLAAGKKVLFANAYPQVYFERVSRGKGRQGAISFAFQAAGVRLRDHNDLRAGKALSAFLTNEAWQRFLGYRDLPTISHREAGERLYHLSLEHDFTLFEYYRTDIAGHRGDMEGAKAVLQEFDEFLGGILAGFDAKRSLLILTSDHGNLEDISRRGHTSNPVFLLATGQGKEELTAGLDSLDDVAPAILRAMGIESQGGDGDD